MVATSQPAPRPAALVKAPDTAAFLDVEALRARGRAYIQQHAADVWTDHNVHDPGMTILDVLCFALTDLAYRTAHPTEDLLAEPPDGAEHAAQFFTAREMLTCSPVTARDYRRLMLDVDGVRDATLVILDDVPPPLYLDREARSLTTTETGEPITLNGLYDVRIELARDPDLGDLNDERIEFDVSVSVGGEDVHLTLDVVFDSVGGDPTRNLPPRWYPAPEHAPLPALDSTVVLQDLVLKTDLDDESRPTTLELQFSVQYADGRALGFRATSLVKNQPLGPLASALEQVLEDDGFACLLQLLDIYADKISRRRTIVSEVWNRLMAHRNLCEDFVSIRGVAVEEVGLCIDLELEAAAEIEPVYAAVLFALDRFLVPDIRFHSLQDLLDAGVPSDQIFDGPQSTRGFADDDDLDRSTHRFTLHGSDLIELMMDVPGVTAVRKLLMSRYVDDVLVNETPESWALELSGDERRVTRLSTAKSRLLFFKGAVPFTADMQEVERLLDELREKSSVPRPAPPGDDLPIPRGTHRDLAGHRSIQHHFAINYGIGDVGLSATATPARKAQAKQLQAYLAVYDQLLADYALQLDRAREVLSVNAPVSEDARMLESRPLDDLPGAAFLRADFVEDLSHDVLAHPSALLSQWDAYQQGPGATFAEQLQHDIEPDQGERRRRRLVILDHLLARFAEDRRTYTALTYAVGHGKDELLRDEAALLRDYADISHDRGVGWDYSEEVSHSNLSGLERRGARLLGFHPGYRLTPDRFLHTSVRQDGKWGFAVNDLDGNQLLTEPAGKDTEEQARSALHQIAQLGADEDNWYIKHGARFSLRLRADRNGPNLALATRRYTTREKAERAKADLVAFFRETFHHEGLLLIEHLLLRPPMGVEDGKVVLPVSISEECDLDPDLHDPYSFRATAILPAWPVRFRLLEFRAHVEQTLRAEAPAHVALKICWIGWEQMLELQDVLDPWREQLRLGADERYPDVLGALRDVLIRLKSQFPEAVLHDCKDDAGGPPVVLGHTSLGTLELPDEVDEES